MMKPMAGLFSLGLLLAGCADQKFGNAQLSSIFGPPITEQAAQPLPTPAPKTIMKDRRKARVAVRKSSTKKSAVRVAVKEKKLAPPPRPQAALPRTASLDGADAACKSRLASLPSDADRRSTTIRVQCFFIGRGEYLTVDGKAKPL